MKRILYVLLVLSVFGSACCLASELASFSADLGEKGSLVLEKGKIEPETVGRFDKIVLKNSKGEEKTVFETEGRIISSIKECEISESGVKDYLLTLETGGSGGFVDFALLAWASGSFSVIWEEDGFKGGEAAFEDKDGDGKPEIVIKSLGGEPGKTDPIPIFTSYKFSRGKISPLRAQ